MSSRCLSDIQTLAIVPNFDNIFYCDSLELIIVDQYKTTVTPKIIKKIIFSD